MGDFKKLDVWRRAFDLSLRCVKLNPEFVRQYLFEMGAQIRRSAASIPANIAEGTGRGSDPELLRFLRIALASSFELETHLLLALESCALSEQVCRNLLEDLARIQRMLRGLIKSLAPSRSSDP